MPYRFVPYDPKHEDALMDLERRTPQGKRIVLEMLRKHFLSRSEVFEKFAVFIALNKEKGDVMGVAAVSIVPCIVEGIQLDAGFGYDLKVDPAYRRMGLAKDFGKKIVDDYLAGNKISNYFITMKADNIAMARTVLVVPVDWLSYDFLYLTIPTFKRIPSKKFLRVGDAQSLKIALFDVPERFRQNIIELQDGLSVWKTNLMYQLKIRKMPRLLQLGSSIVNWFLPRVKMIPGKGSTLQFATLYNFDPENIRHINEALEALEQQNIQYLNVCCTKNDFAFNLLQKYAMNILPYTMLNSFGVEDGQKVTLDVRCL